jgi:glutamate decarboxylase
MVKFKIDLKKLGKKDKVLPTTYGTRYFEEGVPKYEMPKNGMPHDAAYRLIHDELVLDGNPSLNLASFVTTWMEEGANKLIAENINKNFIDHDEYPKTAELENRVVNMLARLFNAPENAKSAGVSTIGSSEAIMLGLLAHKWAWKNRMKAKKKPYNKPNIVMGADVHVCWEKFAKYFDVEQRLVPMEKGDYILTAKKVAENIDENTICVGAILGTTFTGQADEIQKINELLIKVKKTKGWDIPIHVDGASGGFIAPFMYPNLKWDFRLERVKSINVSGHKYGLVYPGLGWLVFRDESDLPKDLVFYVNYLGGEMPTYTLNFSRGSAMVIAQYYNFIRLGKSGYKKIMKNILDNSSYLGNLLKKTGKFELLNDGNMLPIIAVTLKGNPGFTVFDLSAKLREKGWIIPAYTLPPNAEKTAIMRMVVKENFSHDMADMLYSDIMEAYAALQKTKPKIKPRKPVHHKHMHKIC